MKTKYETKTERRPTLASLSFIFYLHLFTRKRRLKICDSLWQNKCTFLRHYRTEHNIMLYKKKQQDLSDRW